MRLSVAMLIGMTVALPIAPAVAQDKADQPRRENEQRSAEYVKELQKERLAILRDLAEQLMQLYQTGRVEVDEALEAKVQLLQAQWDAAENQAERLTFLTRLVEELTEYEKTANARREAGRGTLADVLKIKARRLEVEIQLQNANTKKSEGTRGKVMVANPQFKSVVVTHQYSCQICAQRHIKICAMQKGYIEEIAVNEGQPVKKGDLIFKASPRLYKAKLDAELADVMAAELELQNAERLFQNKVIAPFELALLKTKLVKAQARAEQAKAELSFTLAEAPFDGVIDRLQKQQGSLIIEGEPLTTLSDNSSMCAYFNVPEAHYLEFMAGDGKEAARNIELVLANGGRFQQTGMLGAIEAQANADTGSIPFRADFPNPELLLRHGMTGHVLLHRKLNNAMVIPQRAAIEVLGKRYVYVVDKEGIAHRREVVVRNEVDDSFVIASGVRVADRIVVEGIQTLRDGQPVEVVTDLPSREN